MNQNPNQQKGSKMNTYTPRVRKFTTILALTLPLIGLSACTSSDDIIDLGQPSGTLTEAPAIIQGGSGGGLALSPRTQFAAVDVADEYQGHTFYSTATGGTSGSELINAEVGSVYTTADGGEYVVTEVRTYAEREQFADDPAINLDAAGRMVLAGQDGRGDPYIALIAQRVHEHPSAVQAYSDQSFTASGGGGSLRAQNRFGRITVSERDHTMYSYGTGDGAGTLLADTEVGSVFTTKDGSAYVVTEVLAFEDDDQYRSDASVGIDAAGRLVVSGRDDGDDVVYTVIAQRVSE